MKNQKNNFAILVLSCDKYSLLWEPLFEQFKKYWHDCPFTVYLGSNTKQYKDKKIHTILSGEDKDWSTSLLRILERIPSKYIFLWLDDFFPIEPINTHKFENTARFMETNQVKHIHVAPLPKPDSIAESKEFGVYEKGAPYRISTFGFWEVNALKKLLIPGENPWNFEILGSYRSSYEEGFYCFMSPLVRTLNIVEKGKILSNTYEYCKTHSLHLPRSFAMTASPTFQLQSFIQKIYFSMMLRVHWKIRIKIMNCLRRLLISY